MMQFLPDTLRSQRGALRTCAALLGLAATTWSSPALAEDDQESSEEESTETPDELDEPGYVPGYRRAIDMGLPPYIPNAPPLPGVTTPQYGVPNPTGWTDFRISGFFGGGIGAAIAERERTGPGQAPISIRGPRVPGTQYGTFTNVGGLAGGGAYAQIGATTGTDIVNMNIATSAWSFPNTSRRSAIAGQSNIDAWMTVRIPETETTRIQFLMGSYLDRYGVIQAYGHDVVASVAGIGPKFTLEQDLTETLTLRSEAGFKGDLDTVPYNSPATSDNGWANPEAAPTMVPHAHLGLTYNGDGYRARFNVHGFLARSQYDKVEPERPEGIPDGSIDVFGADAELRIKNHSTFTLAGSTWNLEDARSVNLIRLTNGVNIANFYFGQNAAGDGKIHLVGANWETRIGRFVRGEGDYPDRPELDVQLFSVFGASRPEDPRPEFVDREMLKVGAQVSYQFHKYITFEGRVDRASGNLSDPESWFTQVSPRLIFRSNWRSNESFALVYTHFFLNENSGQEPNLNLPREELDQNLVGLTASISWW